ncbi:MAG: transposase [Actinomycetota bacterium]
MDFRHATLGCARAVDEQLKRSGQPATTRRNRHRRPAFGALVQALDRYTDAGLDARDTLAALPLVKLDARGKKIKGRRRHIATDALGLLLVTIVTAASVQDSAGGYQVLDQLADRHPSVSKVWVDGGYNNAVIRHGACQNVSVEIVKRPASTGFHVLPLRWVVERTRGWLMQHRRLVRDYETLPQRSRAVIHWAGANTMSRFLAGESAQTWRMDPPKQTSPPYQDQMLS